MTSSRELRGPVNASRRTERTGRRVAPPGSGVEARYFFHLCDTDCPVSDDEGTLLADFQTALGHATWCARQIVAEDILAGVPVRLGSYILVQDEASVELGRVYFHEAVTFLD